MKITDDYQAKIKMWAANPVVVPDSPPKLPSFPPQRFNSYEEMNAWTKSLLVKLSLPDRHQYMTENWRNDSMRLEFVTCSSEVRPCA